MLQIPRERPILFSGPMIRALLSGAKTQTRRPVKLPHYRQEHIRAYEGGKLLVVDKAGEQWISVRCPFGEPGDTLWVRETWQQVVPLGNGEWCTSNLVGDMKNARVLYAADNTDEEPPLWRPSIHMPRWAARLFLPVKAVRAERVQDISEENACAEGCRDMQSADGMSGWGAWPEPPPPQSGYTFRNTFRHLWDSINAKRGFGWDANPWVWVGEFEPVVGTCRRILGRPTGN